MIRKRGIKARERRAAQWDRSFKTDTMAPASPAQPRKNFGRGRGRPRETGGLKSNPGALLAGRYNLKCHSVDFS